MTQNSPKFKQINILEHIYIVCMHCLPQSYYREHPITTLCPTNITCKIMVQQNKGKVNRFLFLYLCYLYLKWLQLHLFKLLHHFTTWYTKKMDVLYCHESDVELSHPPSLTRPKFLTPIYGTASFLYTLNQHLTI